MSLLYFSLISFSVFVCVHFIFKVDVGGGLKIKIICMGLVNFFTIQKSELSERETMLYSWRNYVNVRNERRREGKSLPSVID